MKGFQDVLDRLRFVSEAKKSFDAQPKWETIRNSRGTALHQVVVALRLDGVLRGGVQLRIHTPVSVWEEEVYGQIEVRLPGVSRSLRLNPIEWKPMRHHDNPADAPLAHRNERLFDRWHPFEINAQYGAQSFGQSGAGIAVPLPRSPSSFKEYTDLCSELWICADLLGFPQPPWQKDML